MLPNGEPGGEVAVSLDTWTELLGRSITTPAGKWKCIGLGWYSCPEFIRFLFCRDWSIAAEMTFDKELLEEDTPETLLLRMHEALTEVGL